MFMQYFLHNPGGYAEVYAVFSWQLCSASSVMLCLFGSEQDEELAPPQQEGNNRRGAAPARGVGVQGGGADPGGLKRARDSARTVPYIYKPQPPDTLIPPS